MFNRILARLVSPPPLQTVTDPRLGTLTLDQYQSSWVANVVVGEKTYRFTLECVRSLPTPRPDIVQLAHDMLDRMEEIDRAVCRLIEAEADKHHEPLASEILALHFDTVHLQNDRGSVLGHIPLIGEGRLKGWWVTLYEGTPISIGVPTSD